MKTVKTKMVVIAAVLSAAVMANGCTSASLKTEPTTSGIRAAQEAGAADVPRASLHLQLAKEELESAEALSSKGLSKQAESMLMRAEADAALSVALSREDAEKKEATAAVARVHQLQAENK